MVPSLSKEVTLIPTIADPTHPLCKWDRVRELKPTVGDFNGGIVLIRYCQDFKLAVAKVMKLIASLVWTREHWLHEIRISQSYRHQNICAFLDAYCTPTDATLYLELYDLGTLKDLKTWTQMDRRWTRYTCSTF